MKRIYMHLFAFLILLSMNGCSKDEHIATREVMYNMIVNKTWYLDYSITGVKAQAFVGQTTYSITFLKDGTTKDSDGLAGTYTITNNNQLYQLQVHARTANGNALDYAHTIESIGDFKMVQSFTATGQTAKTTLYFTSK